MTTAMNLALRLLWRAELKKLISNSIILFGANGFAALLNALAMVLAAKSLGPAGLGALALITGYVYLIQGFANLESWQALIKYGAEARQHTNDERLAAYFRLSFVLEVACLSLGAVVAILLAPLATTWIGLDQIYLPLISLFSISMLLQAQGAFVGILRLFGDFKVISLGRPMAATVLFTGFALLSLGDHGLEAFVLVTILSEACAAVYGICASFGYVRQIRSSRWFTMDFSPIRGDVGPYTRFLLIGRLSGSLTMIPKTGDVLLVGAILGNAAAGLYRVVRLFAQLPAMIQTPLYQAVYPQIARLAAAGDLSAVRRLARNSALLSGGVASAYWLAYVALGYPFIEALFGSDFSPSWPAGIPYLLGSVVAGLTLPLTPIALAFGRPGISLWATLISVPLFLVLATLLLKDHGLIGIGFAYLAFFIAHSTVMLYLTKPLFTKAEGIS